EDVVVRNDDDLLAVPHLGILAEFLFEDSERARPADIVRHENIDVDPHIFAGRHGGLAGSAGKDLLGHGHRRGHIGNSCRDCSCFWWAYVFIIAEATFVGWVAGVRSTARPTGDEWWAWRCFAPLRPTLQAFAKRDRQRLTVDFHVRRV